MLYRAKLSSVSYPSGITAIGYTICLHIHSCSLCNLKSLQLCLIITPQHLSDIFHGCLLILTSRGLITERLADELSLLILDAEHTLLNRTLHDQSPYTYLAGLSETMNTSYSLVLRRWCPPWNFICISNRAIAIHNDIIGPCTYSYRQE